MPLRIPVIDLVEIGAGGGSIARVNALRNVEVGPQSAGSEPGPACYGQGGMEPTVTDADAVLGLIDPDAFAGGSFRVDLEAARQVLAKVGQPLDLPIEMAAYAVYEMVCESMASAARVHAIEKGKSISDHTLIAFGGAAPLHVARVAEKTGVKRVIIPANAGVGSAVGFLRAPVSYELVRSAYQSLQRMDIDRVSDMLDEMTSQAREVVVRGAAGAPLAARRQAFMRYVGQGHEVEVALPPGRLAAHHLPELRTAFEAAYAALFNRSIPGAEIEVLSWSVLVATPSPGGAAGASSRPCGRPRIRPALRDDSSTGARKPSCRCR